MAGILLHPEVAAVHAHADRRETPCGDGTVVWHRWGVRTAAAPVVLLHGGSGSWLHWLRAIAPLVAAGREVWVPDLPGFGDSATPPSGGDADAIIAPLEAGLQQLVGNTACDMVGFSFGGMTAGMWLAQHPARGQRLVLVGAPAMGVTPKRQFELKGWRHLPTEALQMAVHRHNLGVLMLHDPAQIDGLALQIHVANVLRDRMPRRRLSSTDILAQSLADVRCPVHAIYGEHDALYRNFLPELRAAFASAAPNFRGLQLIADAGHWVQFEATDAFNAALGQVLARG
jgi:2-hydroxy-6-oxonona-2,4-dienedioate hydrolase